MIKFKVNILNKLQMYKKMCRRQVGCLHSSFVVDAPYSYFNH